MEVRTSYTNNLSLKTQLSLKEGHEISTDDKRTKAPKTTLWREVKSIVRGHTLYGKKRSTKPLKKK